MASSHHFTRTRPRESCSGYATSRRAGSRYVVERERRIAVGAQRTIGVERDPPRPAENADVEVEDASRVAAGDEDREERDDRQNEQRQPEQREHDVVRDREDPLHEPEPAAQPGVQLSLDADWIRLRSVHPLLLRAGSTLRDRGGCGRSRRIRRAPQRGQLREPTTHEGLPASLRNQRHRVREGARARRGLRIDVLSCSGSYYLARSRVRSGTPTTQGHHGVRTVIYSMGVSLDCYIAGLTETTGGP